MNIDVLGEFLGTLVLILLGNGVGMSVSLKRAYANQSAKWVLISFAWGFAVLFGVIVAQSLWAPGHLNPAVSLFAVVSGGISFPTFIFYVIVQVLGAFTGQTILYLINYKNIIETNDWAIVKGNSFTAPNYSNFKEKGLWQNLSYEFVATAVLIGLVLAFGRGLNETSLSALGPLPVTLLVVSIGMSLGSVTGYAINPARDFGPRVAFYLFSTFVWKQTKVTPDWSYSFVPVIAPLAAGLVIGGLAWA
ncbi:aquaporin family protein [Mycoplasma iguanae]|uniref:Aquaporin family protein n=1 Tax=Mycoplasma iguanae TaxID=292461 RepID=A0ABY5R8Y5_9MOLU|nr:MIP/aquaporin family protein [Mycoplasma iguanae]UVD81632.1 aquaporin family protein [Mycoplasma iguanae]